MLEAPVLLPFGFQYLVWKSRQIGPDRGDPSQRCSCVLVQLVGCFPRPQPKPLVPCPTFAFLRLRETSRAAPRAFAFRRCCTGAPGRAQGSVSEPSKRPPLAWLGGCCPSNEREELLARVLVRLQPRRALDSGVGACTVVFAAVPLCAFSRSRNSASPTGPRVSMTPGNVSSSAPSVRFPYALYWISGLSLRSSFPEPPDATPLVLLRARRLAHERKELSALCLVHPGLCGLLLLPLRRLAPLGCHAGLPLPFAPALVFDAFFFEEGTGEASRDLESLRSPTKSNRVHASWNATAVLSRSPIPMTLFPSSRSRLASPVKSLSPETTQKQSISSPCNRSTAAAARSMSAAFLPLAGELPFPQSSPGKAPPFCHARLGVLPESHAPHNVAFALGHLLDLVPARRARVVSVDEERDSRSPSSSGLVRFGPCFHFFLQSSLRSPRLP